MDYKKDLLVTMKNPNLVTNFDSDENKGRYNTTTLFSELTHEIKNKDTVRISLAVSFIRVSGYQLFATLIHDALNRGVIVEIITSVYLNVTDPKVLNKFLELENQFENFSFRVLFSRKIGHHMKSYLFEKKNGESVIIIGSSNLSSVALKINLEWNIRYVLEHGNKHHKEIEDGFWKIWNLKEALIVDEAWVEKYEKHWNKHASIRSRENIFDPENNDQLEGLYPREIQLKALEKMIDSFYNQNKRRGILSLATGVGKTHTSAWFAKAIGSRNILFLTPRKEIAVNAKQIFGEVFSNSLYIEKEDVFSRLSQDDRVEVIENLEGKNISCKLGILGGGKTIKGDENFIFSVYNSARIKKGSEGVFEKEEIPIIQEMKFDLIIVDEAHHTITKSIKKIINHFEEINPNVFVLGLTATPFRRVDEESRELRSFYSEGKIESNPILFQWNLFEAIENDDLAFLNYFGITASDLLFKKSEMKGNWQSSTSAFKKYKKSISAESLMQTLETYLWSGKKLRCLIFCVNKAHANDFTNQLNSLPYKNRNLIYKENTNIAECITSDTKKENRESVIQRLEDRNNPLQFIVNVDVFSEGVDIPSINTVVFMRPTESPLIFLQQLGRGLRKTNEKDSLSVFDFVRNDSNQLEIIHRMIDISNASSKYSNLINISHSINSGRSNYEFLYLDEERRLERVDIDGIYNNFLIGVYGKKEILREIEALKYEKNLNDLVSIENSISDGNAKLMKLREGNKKGLLSQILRLGEEIKIDEESLVYKFFLNMQSHSIGAIRLLPDLLIFVFLCEKELCVNEVSADDLISRFGSFHFSNSDWERNIRNFHKFSPKSSFWKLTEDNKKIIFNDTITHPTEQEKWIIQQNLEYFKHVAKKYYSLDLNEGEFSRNLSLHETYTNSDITTFHRFNRNGTLLGIITSLRSKGCLIIATIEGKKFSNKLTNNSNEIEWHSPESWTNDRYPNLRKIFETKGIDCDIFIRFNTKIYPKNLYWYLGKMKRFKIIKSTSDSLIYRITLENEIRQDLYSFMKRVLI